MSAPGRVVRGLAAGFALCALVVAPGCDWLKSSGPGTRSSPFLSSLSISPASGVLCGANNPFTVSFRYSDLQDDISELTLTLLHASSGEQIVQQAPWSDVDRSVAGRAAYAYAFECDRPGGLWEVQVMVTDLDGHTSNTLEGTISLNSL